MSDKADELHHTLDALHERLEESGDLSDESRRQLTETLAEIQDRLAKRGDSGEPLSTPGKWSDRLREAIDHFEDSHADLVQAVDRVARALANIGF